MQARSTPGRVGDRLDAVHPDGHRRPFRQRVEPAAAGVVQPQRIGDQHVLDAVVDEDLGLAQGGHRQPDRSRLQLQPGDLHALVRLRMRPQCHAGGRGGAGGPCDVGLQSPTVDPKIGGRRVRHGRQPIYPGRVITALHTLVYAEDTDAARVSSATS